MAISCAASALRALFLELGAARLAPLHRVSVQRDLFDARMGHQQGFGIAGQAQFLDQWLLPDVEGVDVAVCWPRLAPGLAAKDETLQVGQDVSRKARLLDVEGQAYLIPTGALGGQVQGAVKDLRHIHPDLRKAFAIGGAKLFGKTEGAG